MVSLSLLLLEAEHEALNQANLNSRLILFILQQLQHVTAPSFPQAAFEAAKAELKEECTQQAPDLIRITRPAAH